MREEEQRQLVEKETRVKELLKDACRTSEYIHNFDNLKKLDMEDGMNHNLRRPKMSLCRLVQFDLTQKSIDLQKSEKTIDLLRINKNDLEKQVEKFPKVENKLKLEILNLKEFRLKL